MVKLLKLVNSLLPSPDSEPPLDLPPDNSDNLVQDSSEEPLESEVKPHKKLLVCLDKLGNSAQE